MNNIETEILPEDILMENILRSLYTILLKEELISVILLELVLICNVFVFKLDIQQYKSNINSNRWRKELLWPQRRK